MTVSVLDGVAGLGPARRKRLLAELGSVKAVREAPKEALLSLNWLPAPVAEALWQKIHSPGPSSAGVPAAVAGGGHDE